jgi:hypothetical protein
MDLGSRETAEEERWEEIGDEKAVHDLEAVWLLAPTKGGSFGFL